MIALYLIIIIAIILKLNKKEYFTQKKICNEIDNRCYKISSKYKPETFVGASEKLAFLNLKAIKLIRYLRNKYLISNNYRRKNLVLNLLKRYNPDNLIENSPKNYKNTSYVYDKGEIFALCLREKESGENNFHDDGIITFVLLHELSHLSDNNYGHGKTFWENFKFIIKEAKKIGIYTPVDYSLYPINYCYLDVASNPYFIKNIKDI